MKTKKTTIRNDRTHATLESLAREIKDLHEKCIEGVRSSLGFACETGLRLIKAKKAVKAELGKNQWQAWLREHCALDRRVAQNYMQIAKFGKEKLSRLGGQRCMTITKALLRIRHIRRKGKGRPTTRPATGLLLLSMKEAKRKWRESKRFDKPEALDRTANEQIEEFITARVHMLLNAVQLEAKKAKARIDGEVVDPTTDAVVILRRLAGKLSSPKLFQTAPEGTTERKEKIPA